MDTTVLVASSGAVSCESYERSRQSATLVLRSGY